MSRHHEVVGHTADVGVRVSAESPAALLEEAASALADLIAEGQRSGRPTHRVAVEVVADDLAGLVYAWLSELVSLSDARGEALVGARVDGLRAADGRWGARGVATFVPFVGPVVPRTQVKAATFHRMRIDQSPTGWSLEAYFDV